MPLFDSESVRLAVAGAGYVDLNEFLSLNQLLGYQALAESLEHIAPIALIREHIALRVSEDRTIDGLRESLLRSIREEMHTGWSCNGREWPAVRLLGGWQSEMTATCELQALQAKLEIVASHIIDNALIGWVPDSTDDMLIVAAFELAGLGSTPSR